MGKQRFRLSHMIPNAWFYRLTDMNPAILNKKPLLSAYSSTPNHPTNPFCYTPRYYTSNTNTIINNPTALIYTRPTELTQTHDQDLFLSPTTTSRYESPFSESTRSFDRPPSTSCSRRHQVIGSSPTDVVIEFNDKSYTKKIQDTSGYELIQEIDQLRKPLPILTKCDKETSTRMVEKKEETSSSQSSISIKTVKESISKKPASGVKIRSSSSRTPVCKRIVEANNDDKRQKKSKMKLSSSCCIVRSSFDPQKEFKESMVEMIVEDNIWGSKDLEKLLAAYLSLNPNEYHEMIIKAFEEIVLTFEFVE